MDLKKIKYIFLLFLLVLAGWTIPEKYYYFKDSNQIVYLPKEANYAFSLDENSQPVNITGQEIIGHYTVHNVDYEVVYAPYSQGTYNSNIDVVTIVIFDSDSFETNISLISDDAALKQLDYGRYIFYIAGAILFLELIRANRKGVR